MSLIKSEGRDLDAASVYLAGQGRIMTVWIQRGQGSPLTMINDFYQNGYGQRG